MLRVEHLDVHYGQSAAVRDVSFEVGRGEVVGLIGPNGAGKTTTLRAVIGLLRPSAGRVTFLDRDVTGTPPERLVRQGMALVPEGRHVFGSLSVGENLLLGAKRGQDETDLEPELELFPILRKYFKRPAGKLSGGEQQQLAIARALVSRPKLLLLDEPSLGLAPLVVDSVFASLEGLRESGLTILLVEQNAARAIEMADRTYLLQMGSIALSGSRDELRRTENLAETYLGF